MWNWKRSIGRDLRKRRQFYCCAFKGDAEWKGTERAVRARVAWLTLKGRSHCCRPHGTATVDCGPSRNARISEARRIILIVHMAWFFSSTVSTLKPHVSSLGTLGTVTGLSSCGKNNCLRTLAAYTMLRLAIHLNAITNELKNSLKTRIFRSLH